MKHVKPSRGVIMVMVLMLTIILVILAGTCMALTISQQRSASYFLRHQAAVLVAESGINYAMSRISNNSSWMGCEPGEDIFTATVPGSGMEIYEHRIDGAQGCVEGTIKLGEYTGYFDYYFTKPKDKTPLKFFGDKAPAGSIPEACFLLSYNNSFNSGLPEVIRFDGTTDPKKTVPMNSTLVVCRGKVGEIIKTIETVFTFGNTGFENTVLAAGGNIELAHTGSLKLNERISLGHIQDEKPRPAVMRAGGNIKIACASEKSTKDYLTVHGTGGGRINTGDEFQYRFEPPPAKNLDKFTRENGLNDLIPTLDFSSVYPPPDPGTGILEAGTYCIKVRNGNDPDYNKYPIVYYSTDNTPPVTMDPGVNCKDISESFKDYIDKNEMAWDSKARKITLNKSFKVEAVENKTTGITTTNLNILPQKSSTKTAGAALDGQENRNVRITVQLGPDPIPGKEQPSLSLLNDCSEKASIDIQGELSGYGSVITTGSISMEGESQLFANEHNGLSLYAGGDVTIREITMNPYIPEDPTADNYKDVVNYNLAESCWQKINQEINRQIASESYDKALFGKYISHIHVRGFRVNLDEVLLPQEKSFLLNTFKPYKGQNPNDFYVCLCGHYWATENSYGEKALWFRGIWGPSFDHSAPGIKGNVQYHRLPNLGQYSSVLLEKAIPAKYDAEGRKIQPKDTLFRGLVYANGNFAAYLQNTAFFLQGGLIARNGNAKIACKDMDYIYDSDYLKLLELGNTGKATTRYWSVR